MNKDYITITKDGDRYLVDSDSVQFVIGENSHEKAFIVAQTMVGDGGEIFDYNEFIKSNSLSRLV